MEKSESSVRQQKSSKEVVEDIMVKKEIKPTESSAQELISGSVNKMKKEVNPEGTLIKGLKKLFRKSLQNVRHVEAAEIDAIFSPECQPLKSVNSESNETAQQQKRDSGVSKKGTEPEVDETDAVFSREFQSSTKSNKSKACGHKQKDSQKKHDKTSQKKHRKTSLKNQKKEEKPQGLSSDAMKSLLGGGGHILG